MPDTPAPRPFLPAQPGYHIRRLQQAAVALFMAETADFGITPVQFAALIATQEQPGLDQRTLAATIGFDTSTIGGVIDRLERRGLIRRNHAPHDRRLRLLTLTPEGEALLETVLPAVRAAQRQILAPLPEAQREAFMAMLQTLVTGHQDVPPADSGG
jgi:MarR family transcriptional regulator, lower aerobic nicotinate degradation pathway regulator